MEALSFLKFWKPANKTIQSQPLSPQLDSDEEDDSFFELEIVNNTKLEQINPSSKTTNETELKPTDQTVSLSKRKIIPIGHTISKPHSPPSLLKPSPKNRAFPLKNSKSTGSSKTTTTAALTTAATFKHDSKNLKVRFKIEDASQELSKTETNSKKQSFEDSSKRFSKDSIMKYMKLIKSSYGKSSRFSDDVSLTSTGSSPASFNSTKGNNNHSSNKYLVKSRSASAATGLSSPASIRRDDSLLVQHDGIQNAILHCKKSFNSSRESSVFSRSASTSSQEKLSFSSSEDSYVLSRFSSGSV